MTFGMGLIALAALSGGGASATGEASPATVSAPAEQGAVLAAAQHWLALADAGDWAGSYAVMGAQFRAANTVARWTEVSERVHAELGAFQSRELLTVDYVPAPPNGFWTVKYRANYAKRTGVVETLSLGFEDGAWKVVGVMID